MNWKLRSVTVWFVLLMGARLAFGQVSADQQREFAAHMQKAEGYLRQKQPAQAIPELQAAVALDPSNVDAQGNLGVLLFFQGKLADSIPHFRAALLGKPDLTKIQGLLGLAEVGTLDFDQGRKDLEASFPLIPDQKFKVQVGLELVSLYTQTGDLDEAASVLAKLRKAAPNNPEVLYAAYRTYSDLAGESMLALAIHAPESAQMHQMMAHEETREGKTNDAIAEYRKAIAIDPHLPGVHFELAELLHTSQDMAVKKEAEQEYLAALKENPQDERLLCRLGEMDAQKGDFQKSFEEYSKAAKLQPGDADAKLGLAKTLIELNQTDKALPLLEQTLQEDPTNAVAHYRLGTLYRKEGRMDDAKREIEIYKRLKELKDRLRAQLKDLLIVPNEIHEDEPDEK
ncbi:MAG: tetratricopeptide repeat protein [Terracidiphilus sp.]